MFFLIYFKIVSSDEEVNNVTGSDAEDSLKVIRKPEIEIIFKFSNFV